MKNSIDISAFWTIECLDKNYNKKWEDSYFNLIVNTGLRDILEKYFISTNYTSEFYIALLNGTPVLAPTNTMLYHPGWTEFTGYSSATRPYININGRVAEHIESEYPAPFTITDAAPTIGGAILCTNSTKGGTDGILIGGAPFSTGNKILSATDILNISVSLDAYASSN